MGTHMSRSHSCCLHKETQHSAQPQLDTKSFGTSTLVLCLSLQQTCQFLGTTSACHCSFCSCGVGIQGLHVHCEPRKQQGGSHCCYY